MVKEFNFEGLERVKCDPGGQHRCRDNPSKNNGYSSPKKFSCLKVGKVSEPNLHDFGFSKIFLNVIPLSVGG